MFFSFIIGKTAFGESPQINNPINIVLITADDLGKQLSCYGDDIIKTPNIDRLANEGVVFRNAYVTQASCSSSRSSILTGTYPHTNGQIGLAHLGFCMNKEYPSIPALLKNEGYQTGIIGKLHVEPESAFPFDYAQKNSAEARDVELVAKRAEEFIKSSGHNPFFLYVNYADPHTRFYREYKGHPLNPVNSDDVHAFSFQGVNDELELQRIAGFYNCIQRLDEGIGLLMDKLKMLGALENTLIIFIGDHGAPFSRGKADCYEAGVGIPFIVSYPKTIKSGKEFNALISTVDILPTIMEAVGTKVPESVQGKSLWSLLQGKKDNIRSYLFTEYTFHANDFRCFYPRRAIRDDRYKLILNLGEGILAHQYVNVDWDPAYFFSRTKKYDDTWVRDVFDCLASPPKIELYDLLDDPDEKNNLGDNPSLKKKRDELSKELYKWMDETDDPINEDYLTNEVERLMLPTN